MARMRFTNLKLPLEQVLERATSVIGTGKYSMQRGKNGGNNPSAETPYHGSGTADCVGVMCWIQGIDRYQHMNTFPEYGGWMNTDSIMLHVQSRKVGPRLWAVIPPWDAIPGDVVVYPSYRDFGDSVLTPGHCMTLVPRLSPPGDYPSTKPVTVMEQVTHLVRGFDIVHCHGTRLTGGPATTRGKVSIPARVIANWRVVRPTWRQ